MEEMKIIARVVMDYFSCAYDDLNCKDRHRHRVVARQIVMALARKYTKLSLREIGEYFTRDHSTAIYGVRKVEELMFYKDFNTEYQHIDSLAFTAIQKYRKEMEMRKNRSRKFVTTDPGLINGFKRISVAVI
jgi:chromosomal replication initiation ATPase DnaA